MVTSFELLGSGSGELPKQSKYSSSTLVVRFDHIIELTRLEKPEVLDEVENSFDLDQRSSRNIREAAEFLRTAAADTFGEIQHDAIASTTPLIRQVAFGRRESIDERARQYR